MSICCCTPKQKASGRMSTRCAAHNGHSTKAYAPRKTKPRAKPRLVGKIVVDHDDPKGELPWSVVAEHENEKGEGWSADLLYFSTRRAADDCAKDLRAVLRTHRRRG